MSLAIVYSRALFDIQAPLVTVETDLSKGMPGFSIVGLPEAAVRESRDRVRSALMNGGFEFPHYKLTVNLAPADLPKEGGRFDLAIAVGIILASGQLPTADINDYELVGELALSGDLRPVSGVLPIALAAKAAGRKLILPRESAEEARMVSDLEIFPADNLLMVCDHLSGMLPLEPLEAIDVKNVRPNYLDLKEVYGQQQARRALEIAAAGRHSLLFVGPPGTGKTMLASRLPSILGEMTDEEALEAATISSISHQGFQFHNFRKRAFRAPHHSASSVALVGGGNPPRPGEISLAHHGVLFLDELPEFSRHVLETLREPMESGTVTISRAARQSEFPAKFQLIAAMNPCPCGFLNDPSGRCHCTREQVDRYRTKISGPILDRIDMHVTVPRLPFSMLALQQQREEESSDTVCQRVCAAQAIQRERCQTLNANLTTQQLKKFCFLEKPLETLLHQIMEKFQLSARSYHRILRLARTIADLDGSELIQEPHLMEAIQFRRGG